MTLRPTGAPRAAVAALSKRHAMALGWLILVAPAGAVADSPSAEGPWTMAPLTETFILQQWGGACGAAPVSRTVLPGGPATIRKDRGELVISLEGGRELRTDACLDAMPTLARETHSADGRTWRTRCTTPPKDPRRALVNTAFFWSADDTMSIGETGRYELAVGGARCVAEVNRQSSMRRAPALVPPSAAASAGPESAAIVGAPAAAASADPSSAGCSSPGDPARLEVRPSRKLLRVGEDYRFRAIVLDSNGCPTGTPIRWTITALRPEGARDLVAQPTIDGAGRLSVPTSVLSDAKLDVVATAAGHSARAAVEITSAQNYEALLAQSGLDPNGERAEPAIASLATSTLGASGARSEDGARRRRAVFIGVVGGLSLLLGAVAVVAALRARKARAIERAARERHADKMRAYEREKREREESHAVQVRAHLESLAEAQRATAMARASGAPARGSVFCPSCHREFTAGTAYCPFDANQLVELAGHEDVIAGPVGGICPTCRRGYNPGVRLCPHDGDELVPPAMAAVRQAATRGKICPTCGGRFEGSAAFCGKDGTMLVLLN